MTCPACGGETATWTEQQLVLALDVAGTTSLVVLTKCRHCDRLTIITEASRRQQHDDK